MTRLRLLLLLCLLPWRLFAATGDILSVTVNADGRSATVRVAGVGTGGTYLYDAVNADLRIKASAKIVLAVTSDSFSGGVLGSTSRLSYGAITQRTPGVTTANETVAGSDLDIVIALAEPVFNDDTVTATFLSAWYTKSGTPSNARASFSVTNSSTLDYYIDFGQWDILPAERVTGDFRVAFSPRHMFGTDMVRFTATGGTSGATYTANVSTETKRLHAATGLYTNCHEITVPIAGFTQGEQINLRAEVFPLVGDTKTDTNDYSADYEVSGHTPIWVVCDKSNTLLTYGFVTVAAGGGTASTTLATAQADPFPTIKAAIDAGATMVYLNGLAHDFASRSTAKTGNFWTTVQPAPGNAGVVAVRFTGSFPNTRVQRLKFKNVTTTVDGTTATPYGELGSRYLAMENVIVDTLGFTLAEGPVDFDGIYYRDVTWVDGSKWKLSTAGGDRFRRSYDGCRIPTAGEMKAFWRMMGCFIDGTAAIQDTAAEGIKPFNVLIEGNKLMNCQAPISLFTWQDQTGSSLIGNVIEGTDLGGGQLLSIAEGSTFICDHVTRAHNTQSGARSNLFYNDNGSTAYFSRGIRNVGNIDFELDTKHDLFPPANAARIGRWWYAFGTSSSGNFSLQQNFPPTWGGINFVLTGTAGFVNNRSGTTGGGFGDYRLTPNSSAARILEAGTRVVRYDLIGNEIPNDGSGAAGAYPLINYTIVRSTGVSTIRSTGTTVVRP